MRIFFFDLLIYLLEKLIKIKQKFENCSELITLIAMIELSKKPKNIFKTSFRMGTLEEYSQDSLYFYAVLKKAISSEL